MNTDVVLAASRVSKRFGATQALADVSVSLDAGTVLALVGENGAGKSTLVRILAGYEKPDSGEVDRRALLHLVHQELSLLPERDVTENIFAGREVRGRSGLLDWPTMRARARAALDSLGEPDISPLEKVGKLTPGAQQVVEIARGLESNAKIVILDEPTAALSPSEVGRFLTLIRAMAERGTSFIYISHRLDEVQEVSDSVTVLKDGRTVGTFATSDLTQAEMIRLMVGREISNLFPDKPAADDVRSEPILLKADATFPPNVTTCDMEIHEHEVAGIYGLEGHGQDEVLEILAGARRPARGSVRLRGSALPRRRTPGQHDVGYVASDRKTAGIIPQFSGVRNLTLPILRRFTTAGVVRRKVELAFARSAITQGGIRGDMSRSVAALSGGNQQKVLVMRWVCAGSQILLLNQPTRGVDIGAKAEIYRAIREHCAGTRSAAVVVSPEISELRGLCDRIFVMSKGRMVGSVPADASEQEILSLAVAGDRS